MKSDISSRLTPKIFLILIGLAFLLIGFSSDSNGFKVFGTFMLALPFFSIKGSNNLTSLNSNRHNLIYMAVFIAIALFFTDSELSKATILAGFACALAAGSVLEISATRDKLHQIEEQLKELNTLRSENLRLRNELARINRKHEN